ncbi:hypothetical protein OUZ56_017161 [Daphnia magna]|uniref:Uncharacterized protein n=1 Tax=Daphnia magna TaxID=35525 RepID=A0ABR0AS93_9CRUS|nr:hypothetical protein OUZ56_017161 [Daphnia magna]
MAVKPLTDWFGERRVAVEAVYLASKLNVEADEESRTEADACVGGWIWQSLHSLVGLGHLMLICVKKLLSFLFPSLDWPTLVSTLAGTIVRNSLDITFKPNVFDIHSGGGALSVSFQRSTPGRLESLRRILEERKVYCDVGSESDFSVRLVSGRESASTSISAGLQNGWLGCFGVSNLSVYYDDSYAYASGGAEADADCNGDRQERPGCIENPPTEAFPNRPLLAKTDIALTVSPPPQPLAEASQEAALFSTPVVPKEICREIASLLAVGVSTDQSTLVSKEFPFRSEEEDFSLKTPKLDRWISRRAKEKNVLKTVNSMKEMLIKTQLKIMDIDPPLIDLYSRVSATPDDIPAESEDNQLSAPHLLKDESAFTTGKETREHLFTGEFLSLMLWEANQDETSKT